MLAATLGGCGSRGRDLLRQKSKSSGPGDGPLQPAPAFQSSPGAALRDSTLVAWYRFRYAPRTGGAYDSHHRTAGIAGRTRRRGGPPGRSQLGFLNSESPGPLAQLVSAFHRGLNETGHVEGKNVIIEYR